MNRHTDCAGFLQHGDTKLSPKENTAYYELYGPLLYRYKTKPVFPTDKPAKVVDVTNAKFSDVKALPRTWSIHTAAGKTVTLTATALDDVNKWKTALANPIMANAKRMEVTDKSDDEDKLSDSTIHFAANGREKVSFNDFERVSVIGKGSFSRVYFVRKKDTGEEFAMKEMNKELVEREKLTEKIRSEKTILQRMTHPFIVRLHYAFQTQNQFYLVLDLLSGGELFFHLGNEGTFEESRAKFYTAEIGLALGHLHSLKIIYRDLKPENAVLDKDGNVCLTDFGLAKQNVADAGANTFCGTPEYLAPEFLLGENHGPAVDWWSLGIMLYEMLFGLPPFYDENQNTMYDLIMSADLEFPDDEITVSAEAKDLLRKLLVRNPSQRLRTVEDFKRHPFFRDIDFEKLYNKQIPPPFKPNKNTVANFSDEFTTESTALAASDGDAQHGNLLGFTYDETLHQTGSTRQGGRGSTHSKRPMSSKKK